LQNEQICVWLAESIKKASISHNFRVLAFVFMPDHVHLLIHPQGESYRIADILKSMKQGVSRRAVNAGLIKEILWEPGGGHDRNITSPQAMQNAIGYIHMNPVRKELCTNILEYKWSSARTLVLGEIGEIDVDGSDWLS
jgi:putative transposase